MGLPRLLCEFPVLHLSDSGVDKGRLNDSDKGSAGLLFDLS